MSAPGFFAVGIFNPKSGHNQGTLWRTALAFGAAFVFTVGRRFERQSSDTSDTHAKIPMFHFATVEDLAAHLPYGCRLVGIELTDEAVPLATFAHPDRACYLLGSEDNGLPPAAVRACHVVVRIDGLAGCLNVATAGAVVLYDRMRRAEGES